MATILNQQTFALAPLTIAPATTTTELFIASPGATPTTLAAFGTIYNSLPVTSILTITGIINGLSGAAAADGSCGGTFTASFRWDYNSGVLSQIGAATVVVKSDATATFAVTGTNLVVTGIDGQTFAWHTVFTTMIN